MNIMKYYSLTLILILFVLIPSFSQKYKLVRSHVSFFSEAPLENITAENKESRGVIDSENNNITFLIPIDKFVFEKSLMQEHFNEKYMHSDKYPRSTFSGKISGLNLKKSGKQTVTVSGKINIHGVEKNLTVTGIAEVKNKILFMDGDFNVKLEDFNIERPQIMWQNIAEEIEVKLHFEFSLNE